MALNALNQNLVSSQLNSFMTTLLGIKTDKNANNSYYAKEGEPMYQEDMDSDKDGIVSFDEFKEYCQSNNISSKDVSDMIEMRMAYRMSQYASDALKKADFEKLKTGSLDLIYANDGDGNYDAMRCANFPFTATSIFGIVVEIMDRPFYPATTLGCTT